MVADIKLEIPQFNENSSKSGNVAVLNQQG